MTHLVATEGIGAWLRWLCRKLMRCWRDGFIGLLPPDLTPPRPANGPVQFAILLFPLWTKQNYY